MKNNLKIASMKIVLAALILVSGKVKAQSPALLQAIKMTDNEQFDKATSAFKALIVKDALNADAYFYYGENLLAAEKLDSAEVQYKLGIEKNPKAPLNHIGLAKVYRLKGKTNEAQTSFDAAFNLFTEKGVKIKDEMKVRAYVEGAECLIEGTPKNTVKGMELIGKALALDEMNVAAYIVKGEVLFEQDQLNATDPIAAFKKAAEIDKTSAKAVSKIAYMYFRGGQKLYERSIEFYTEAIKIDANFAPAYAGRGLVYYYSGKTDEAIADYKKYSELNKGNIAARKRYIYFLIISKKTDDAMNEIGSVEKLIGTEDVGLSQLKAYALFDKGDYANALKAMEYYFSKQIPSKITANDYEYLGRIHQKLGNEEKYSENFKKAVTMDPKGKIGLINEVVAYYKEKKNSKMQALWLEMKIKFGSKDANDFYYLGGSAYDAKLCGKADTALTEYVKQMPDFAPAWLTLARAKDCSDTLTPKKWNAKEAYVTYLSKLKPEESEKNKSKISEAYYFLARYYYASDAKDYALAKCYCNKIVGIAHADYVERANALLKQKVIADATAAAECK